MCVKNNSKESNMKSVLDNKSFFDYEHSVTGDGPLVQVYEDFELHTYDYMELREYQKVCMEQWGRGNVVFQVGIREPESVAVTDTIAIIRHTALKRLGVVLAPEYTFSNVAKALDGCTEVLYHVKLQLGSVSDTEQLYVHVEAPMSIPNRLEVKQ